MWTRLLGDQHALNKACGELVEPSKGVPQIQCLPFPHSKVRQGVAERVFQCPVRQGALVKVKETVERTIEGLKERGQPVPKGDLAGRYELAGAL